MKRERLTPRQQRYLILVGKGSLTQATSPSRWGNYATVASLVRRGFVTGKFRARTMEPYGYGYRSVKGWFQLELTPLGKQLMAALALEKGVRR